MSPLVDFARLREGSVCVYYDESTALEPTMGEEFKRISDRGLNGIEKWLRKKYFSSMTVPMMAKFLGAS